MRLLLVEDNLSLANWLALTLRRQKYGVDCVSRGEDADHVLQTEDYALVVLDLALPDMSGFEILRRLRARGNGVPVLILTANDTLDARLAGLDGGADDYLAKPFEIAELEARIRAQLRRANSITGQPLVQCGSLQFDTKGRRFTSDGKDLLLTAREHAVLEALILRSGATVSKVALTRTVFGFEDEANPSAIEIYVHRLRKKLAGNDVEIVTLRGLGYVLKASSVV